jgi:hypothetical protein
MVHELGGGKIISIVIRKAFSIISGNKQERMEDDVSKHGLVLTSISQGWRCLSIMKSSPKI